MGHERNPPPFTLRRKRGMAGLYIGSTTGYSGKNMIVMGLGLRLQKDAGPDP